MVLNRIAHAKDPVGLVREVVLASGGSWIDAATVDIVFLFEVNLHGVRGFGVLEVIDNLISNLKAIKSNEKVINCPDNAQLKYLSDDC